MLLELREAVRHEENTRLRHGLDDEHAGHDRNAGEMPLEERFVEGKILIRANVSAGHQLVHAIHQMEGIAMGQDAQDLLDAEGNGLAHGVVAF